MYKLKPLTSCSINAGNYKSKLRECPRENRAGGDNTQVTDFAQTWHKC